MYENNNINERFELAINRIESILTDNSVREPFNSYFQTVTKFIIKIKNLMDILKTEKLKDKSIKQLRELNDDLYEDIIIDNYQVSYANPEYAVRTLGETYGKLLSFLYTEVRSIIVYAYEGRLTDITITYELFIQIYNYFEADELPSYRELKEVIYYYIYDYSSMLIEYRVREQLDQSLSFATDIIMNSDLNDLRYLYSFGEYITQNELKTASYLNNLPEDKILAMAKTYTDAFILGFKNSNIDISNKTTVNIRYSIGFERIIRQAIIYFKEHGLEPIIYRTAVSSINKKNNLKIGYYSTSPNKQYDYDHRADAGLYVDKALNEKKLVAMKAAYEKYKLKAKNLTGPAVMEVFGDTPFEPLNKIECITLNNKQQQLTVDYNNTLALLINEYISKKEFSFTIIAYPIPSIGEKFEEIFDEIVKVNTLDTELYRNIHEILIKTLDKGKYVHLLGSGDNKTDIKVSLHEIENKDTQTNFINCLADVNIPVGEVFTTPLLKGTTGTLNISTVYLKNLQYKNLNIKFTDGLITDYNCSNFSQYEENKKYIKDNLLNNHETLPIGEFAIGTNTTAYVMANKYDIVYKLPILIVEKMGPHFAIGDSCFSMCEDNKEFNPDGKEMIAKDNEISILRKTEKGKAYFDWHTDITIPYDELKEISVYTEDGERIVILEDGRFVLEGTEELNVPFELS